MGNDKDFDIAVIGAGPGGYTGAIRAAQLGLRVALIEKNEQPGGTCLHVGCIPSKALLDSSHRYREAKERFSEHGILIEHLSLDLHVMMQRKNKIIDQLTRGVRTLLKGNNISCFHGEGKLISATEIEMNPASGQRKTIVANNIVLATGSEPSRLPFLPFDGDRIVSSTEALSFDRIPKQFLVVGAGAIGLEMASVWSALGSQVTVIEILSQIAPGLDAQIAKNLQRTLKKQGLNFSIGTRIDRFENGDTGIQLLGTSKDGKPISFVGEKVLVATGRKPLTRGLGLESIGIQPSLIDGRIEVNEKWQTPVTGVYAIGDLTGGPMLAHRASAEGIAVAEIISGLKPQINFDLIPNIIYTHPEVATVGHNEDELLREGTPFSIGTSYFRANGRALCMDSPEGLIRVYTEKPDGRLLGVHIMGPSASELIMEALAVMSRGGCSADISRLIHPHPTLTETLKEATLPSKESAISIPGKTLRGNR